MWTVRRGALPSLAQIAIARGALRAQLSAVKERPIGVNWRPHKARAMHRLLARMQLRRLSD